MTPLDLGLGGLGLDLAKPKPFSLSFKRVAPWYRFVVERPLDEVDEATLAIWDVVRLMTRPWVLVNGVLAKNIVTCR